MLRIRSRTVTSKQNKVGEHHSNHNHHHYNHPWFLNEKSTKNSSTFFTSSTILKGFYGSDIDSNPMMMNPISMLGKSPFSGFRVFNNKPENNAARKNTQHCKHVWEQICSKQGIGLALVDENSEKTRQRNGNRVVFGSQLRIKAQNSSVFSCFSPQFPAEFGIKTPRNKLCSFGSKIQQTQFNSNPKNEINGVLMSEIDEQSEDYTCVISHGPNPRTTHIFGNCIVESCCGKKFELPKQKTVNFSSFGNLRSSKDDFLSFCHYCKKKLGEGRDIYMYRGEQAFCSEECRCREVYFDEVEN